MPYRDAPDWAASAGTRFRRRATLAWIAWLMILVLSGGAIAVGWMVVDDLDGSLMEDLARGGESEVLGMLCIVALLSPALIISVLYLVRSRRLFVSIHEEGIVVLDAGGRATLRWDEVTRIRRDVHEELGGARREWGWWLETDDGRKVHVAFEYPDEVRASIASRLAKRGIRPEHPTAD